MAKDYRSVHSVAQLSNTEGRKHRHLRLLIAAPLITQRDPEDRVSLFTGQVNKLLELLGTYDICCNSYGDGRN